MTEEEIAAIFDRVTQNLYDPRIDAVVERAERDAYRIRRRHRGYAAGGSALAVAAIAVAGLAITVLPRPSPTPGVPAGLQQGLGHGPRGHKPTPAASASGATASPSATGNPSPAPSSGGAPGAMTTTQIMDQLQAMLPAGATISDIRADSSGEVEFDYNDGQGAVDFMFWIEPVSFYQNPLTCSESPWSGTTDEGPRPAGALPQSCVMNTLPDGSIVQDWVPYADAYGFYGYKVADQRPDGTVVSVQVGNGINHTLPQVDRAIPPGSFTEWNALVESPVWHL
jgi:hypothetical protein